MPSTFKDPDGKNFEVEASEVVLISSEIYRPPGKKDEETVERMATIITIDRGKKWHRSSEKMKDVALRVRDARNK